MPRVLQAHPGEFLEEKLWIRIRIGSVFRSFLDPEPYSEYRSGSTHINIGLSERCEIKIKIHNSEFNLVSVQISLGGIWLSGSATLLAIPFI